MAHSDAASTPDVTGGITQRSAKLTMKQAEDLGNQSSSLLNHWQRNQRLYELMSASLGNPAELWVNGSRAVRGLGDPLVRMRGYESTPGLWVLDDEPTGIVFLLWSDGYKKRPWKGTSYEAIATSAQELRLHEAYARLLAYLRERLPTPGPDEL